MTPRRLAEISAFVLALVIAALAIHAWMAARDDQVRMQSTLAAQKQLLDAVDARERERAATLKDTLAQIDALKRAAQTPATILRELPKYLPLPVPISLASSAPAASPAPATSPPKTQNAGQGSAAPDKSAASISSPAPSPVTPSPAVPNLPAQPLCADAVVPPPDCYAQIPAADLKPLYDYVQDCRACQASLTAAKENAADDAAKIAALIRERDAAITAAKGGGFWLRLRRNTRWLVIGAAAGATAVCASGHCK